MKLATRVENRADVLLDALVADSRDEARAAASKLQRMLEFADIQQGLAELEENPTKRGWLISAVADEIALALHLSVTTVQNMLHRGRLARARMPKTWLAFTRGQIDAYVVQQVAQIASRLERDDSFIRFDEACARYAATHTPAQTFTWAKRRVDALEPWTKAAREKDAHINRKTGVSVIEEGGGELWATYPTQMALDIKTALTASLQDKAADDPRTRDQYLADELYARITGNGETHLVATEVVVTVPVTSLAGLDDTPAASLDERFTLPAQVVRELASDTETVFYRALTDPVGHVLDVTRLGRFFTGDLRTAIKVRDGHCQGPGCNHPIREIDHVVPTPEGPTSGANGQGLCKRTHQQKTIGVLHVEIVDGTPVWTTPLGRSYVAERITHPPDHGLAYASPMEYQLAQLLANGPPVV